MRGDQIRLDMHRKTRRVLDRLRELGIYTPNTSGCPIIEIPLATTRTSTRWGATCSTAAST